jgi:pimeloyl-ACP methyl ester carboxylesterase
VNESRTLNVHETPAVEIVVPLRAGRFYSVLTFVDACNRALGTNYERADFPDEERELSRAEKAVLLAANDWGLLKIQLEPDRLILWRCDQSDGRALTWLERLLGLSPKVWPAALGLHVPDHFRPSQRTVLLIHGLESKAANMRPLQAAFERWGIQVILFDYPNDGPLGKSGTRLRDELLQFSQCHPDTSVVVIAHSMGGLVARYALEMPGDKPQCVSDLFMLGTPNDGSRLARAQPWLELFGDVLPELPRLHDLAADGLGEAADDLDPRSPFLTALNAQRTPEGVRYFCVLGRKSFLDDERASIERELVQLSERRMTPDASRRLMLDMLRADELKDGHGDGAVTLRSARLATARGEKVCDLNHTELIACPTDQPEDSEVFRWIVDTLGWQKGGTDAPNQ